MPTCHKTYKLIIYVKKKNYVTQFYSYEIVAKYVILKIFQQINAHKASRSLTVKHGGQCYFNKSTAKLK